jgi:hypothetical protein
MLLAAPETFEKVGRRDHWATAVVLFPILRRQNEAVSLGYVTLRPLS